MKKITILLCVFIMASCSSDGGGNEWVDEIAVSGAGELNLIFYSSITIESECGNASTQIQYCVSGSVRDEVVLIDGQYNTEIAKCTKVTFIDVDGISQTGLYHGSISIGDKKTTGCK